MFQENLTLLKISKEIEGMEETWGIQEPTRNSQETRGLHVTLEIILTRTISSGLTSLLLSQNQFIQAHTYKSSSLGNSNLGMFLQELLHNLSNTQIILLCLLSPNLSDLR